MAKYEIEVDFDTPTDRKAETERQVCVVIERLFDLFWSAALVDCRERGSVGIEHEIVGQPVAAFKST